MQIKSRKKVLVEIDIFKLVFNTQQVFDKDPASSDLGTLNM